MQADPWEYSYKGLEMAQRLGQLGVFLPLGGARVSGWCPMNEHISEHVSACPMLLEGAES
jgi:hypothetical protein